MVLSNNADDINEDRYLALRKRAEVDTKYLLNFNPNDDTELKQSLTRHALYFCFFGYVSFLCCAHMGFLYYCH